MFRFGDVVLFSNVRASEKGGGGVSAIGRALVGIREGGALPSFGSGGFRLVIPIR